MSVSLEKWTAAEILWVLLARLVRPAAKVRWGRMPVTHATRSLPVEGHLAQWMAAADHHQVSHASSCLKVLADWHHA